MLPFGFFSKSLNNKEDQSQQETKPIPKPLIGARPKRNYNATNLSGFDVRQNSQQMAAVCQIFILQQIKFEKNGFHRLLDWLIGF